MKVLTLCILGGVQVVNECCVIGKVLNEPEEVQLRIFG